MKKLFFAFAAFTLVLNSCSSDDDTTNTAQEVSNAVRVIFRAEFPNATDVEYTKVANDYEIDFKIADVDYKALYKGDATFVKYKYDILSSELPQTIITAVETDFEDRKIDDTEILLIDGTNYYQLELENQPNDDQLVFNSDGALNASIYYWD